MGNFSETIVAVPADEAKQEWLCDLSDAGLLDAWARDQLRPPLAELIKRFSVMVLSVCRRGCAREVDVDDAFQTTFLYLARNAGSIRHPERLAGWLQRVAQRSAVAMWKKNRFRWEPLGDPVALIEDPLDQLTHRHESVVLDQELADLPEKYHAVIVLHHDESTTVSDLAIHFGTTVGAIRGRLQRGRKNACGTPPATSYDASSCVRQCDSRKCPKRRRSGSRVEATHNDGRLRVAGSSHRLFSSQVSSF